MESSPDDPAPAPRRGFFAGLLSISSVFDVSSSGREGNPIAIFFVFFAFGGGKDRPECEALVMGLLEEDDDGGGRASDDFLEGGGSFERSDDWGFVGGGDGDLSSPLSASLP